MVGEKIKIYRRAGLVRRYHTEVMLKEETLSHHSANVAYICGVLTDNPSANLLMGALTHDMAELYTGDVPFPFKAGHPNVKEYLDRVEEKCLHDWGLHVTLTEDEERILKAADMLDLVLKSLDEMAMGNSLVAAMFNRGLDELRIIVRATFPEDARERLVYIIKELEEWKTQMTAK